MNPKNGNAAPRTSGNGASNSVYAGRRDSSKLTPSPRHIQDSAQRLSNGDGHLKLPLGIPAGSIVAVHWFGLGIRHVEAVVPMPLHEVAA